MKKAKANGLLGKITLLGVVLAMIVTLVCVALPAERVNATEIAKSDKMDELMNMATSFVVVYHKQLGGSHYAYTEGLAEELEGGNTSVEGNESNFRPGSKMTLVTLRYEGDKIIREEQTLVNCRQGVVRDPDVSPDGTKIVFSMKQKSTDDFHLYIYDLTKGEKKQITFGNGAADMEPVFAADGSIVFSSSRDIQTVDCWKTPVSNLYRCDADGSNITRLGYDQVHTTYPTKTEDGRIIYTRWDYNDRNQMFIQGLFQMFPDGTNQTELFGNNLSTPTTLLHTRQIPGVDGKYFSIACGHHQYQCGKLLKLDINEGRNDTAAVDYIWDDAETRALQNSYDIDTDHYQVGRVYKYPYPVSEDLVLVSTAKSYSGDNTPFNIELINTKKANDSIVIAKGTNQYPASQIVPVKTTNQFNRASLVNYGSDVGTYYVGNVYAGQSIAAGTVKYLRVVGLEFRSSAIGATNGRGHGTSDPYSPIATGNGAWDVKKVLGIVPVYEDGSAMFTCPSEIPVYFQLLDAKGDVVQSMRSWSTLMPGEYFSCIGCHVDKNLAPDTNATITQAMKNGVSQLQPDLWMSIDETYDDYDPYTDDPIGFDYLSTIQPILNKSCVSCHSDASASYKETESASLGSGFDSTKANYLIDARDQWYYTTSTPASGWQTADITADWTLDYAPFGKIGTAPGSVNTVWDSSNIYLRKSVDLSYGELSSAIQLKFYMAYTGSVEIFVNGTSIYTANGTQGSYTNVELTPAMTKAFKVGTNDIAVKITAGAGGQYFDLAFMRMAGGVTSASGSSSNLIDKGSEWLYTTSSNDKYGFANAADWTKVGFDTSDWKSGKTPFGNRIGAQTTDWATNDNNYLWARKTFTIDDLSALGDAFSLSINAFYDDDFYLFINGHLVYSDPERWNDNYTDYAISGASFLQKGENVVAVCLRQHTGGYEFDMSMTATPAAANYEFSLRDTEVYARRMKKQFPLSYLVLTASRGESSGQFVANATNKYTNWISSMSQCEMLNPYQYGANKSSIMRLLRSGHGNLTDAEIRAFACWIDLEVPCYGTYDVKQYWNSNEIREYEEELNKRNFYDRLNEYARLARAGSTPEGEITISYKQGTKEYSTSGTGMVQLYTDKYATGGTVSIKLPTGSHYFALSLNSRVAESIIYCPDSTYEFKFPKLTSCYPTTMNSSQGVFYQENTITARLVGEDELSKTHNIALNAYDLPAAEKAYPHVTSSTSKTGDQYAARNVIDGFTANKDKGNYPNQSWQASSYNNDTYLTIDFGSDYRVDELILYIRRANGDAYFTSCKVTFSDGTTTTISLTSSADAQSFDMGGKVTSSIKLSDFVVETTAGTEAAISEIQVMGAAAK